MERDFLNPLFARSKFIPSELFKQSNPRYFEKPKFPERINLETAEEKRARLTKLKQERMLTTRKRPKVTKVPTLFKDPTQKHAKSDTQKPANVTWEQRFDKFGTIKNTFGFGLDQTKTKTKREKQTQLEKLEKQRYFDRIRSSEQERITSEDFEKKRKHHGMNYYEYREFIKDHGGKTPDEVFKQGEWKVKKTTVIPKVPLKQKVSDPYVALREYMREQHNVNIPINQPITQKQFPWLAMTAEGKPALYGDAVLHDKLKLGDAYRVVTSKTGILHKAYDPSKVQPKFYKTHETSVVRSY